MIEYARSRLIKAAQRGLGPAVIHVWQRVVRLEKGGTRPFLAAANAVGVTAA